LDLDESQSNWSTDLLPRNNIDPKQNDFGLELIQLCSKHNLIILNGRFGISSNQWTHTHHNASIGTDGSSVVDWALANENVWHKISQFRIEDFTEFSDHAELLVSLNLYPNCQLSQRKKRTNSTPKTQKSLICSLLVMGIKRAGNSYLIAFKSLTQ
jgi:hypothetical protein